MAEVPDNIVLVQLREIRAKLESIGRIEKKLDEHDKRFDRLDEHFEEMRLYVNHALGLGTVNDLKAREIDARQKAEAERRRRLEDRFDDVERRLARVEEKVE